MSVAEIRAELARKMPEKVLQERVRKISLAGKFTYYHTHRAQHSPAGFPDCFLWRFDASPRGTVLRIVVAEIKRAGEKPTAEQERWLDMFTVLAQIVGALTRATQTDPTVRLQVFLWTPLDLASGEIERTLL